MLFGIFMSLLLRPQAWQLYHIENLRLLGHTMTVSVLNIIKETLYEYIFTIVKQGRETGLCRNQF
jgi:hypothetical protein